MQDAYPHNTMVSSQHNGFSSRAASCGISALLMASFDPNTCSSQNAQNTLFAPSQATSFNPFAGAQPGSPARFCQTQPFASKQLNTNLLQQHHYQQQCQQRVQEQTPRETYVGHHQPQRANMGQQRCYHQMQTHASTRQNHQHQHAVSFQSQQMVQQQQRYKSPGYAPPSPALTPQQTPKQTSEDANVKFKPLSATHPQVQKPMAFDFINTMQQFTQQSCRPETPQRLDAATSLPSPRITPTKRIHTPQVITLAPAIPQPQQKTLASVHPDTACRNEIAERVRLERERKQRAEQYAKRRDELRKDTSAIYHCYSEVLECFPLSRGERPSPYLAGLLANQPIPAEPTSDRGLAIQYAKQNWQSYWELKDLDYVVDKAKKDIEKKVEERRQTMSDAATAPRR
ncbi:hypothetical protein BU25DRAFT_420444 [Macroventuria anomochaeta]|uniref:Uncharacterized protein n=1 Tax=Macroventuria anomochaeta TaxID=301207 RepID=A0ACB6S4C6_9PLEO|nr:uncharacterized protein BU25DRAFT_420444 [Macroventuria anomochaeta]KAF2629026.1 hypothetical protein BU25DRAFT_420444 [Macroventuria anomochaeta]